MSAVESALDVLSRAATMVQASADPSAMEISRRADNYCIWQPWLAFQLNNARKSIGEERPKGATNLHRKPSSAWRRERRRDPIQSEALDMSSSSSSASRAQQQHGSRPSVIVPVTSAAAAQAAHSPSSEDHFLAATTTEDTAVTPTASATPSAATRGQRTGIRSAGVPSDPAIDEHFKRSLGLKDYAAVFDADKLSAQDKEAGLTVDDHFAKALGETWTRLQATKPST